MIIDPTQVKPADCQKYLQHIIAPRPICFASTIDATGQPNVSPFSFFNLFSVSPPILVFSPSRRLRNNTTKHTLENVHKIPEVVINIVTYNMVQQVSLASCEYPKEVNQFTKAGFTAEPASIVRPPMVKECPVKIECQVDQIISLGEEGGAGQLVVCKVLAIHINEDLLSDDGFPDQEKLDLVARLGSDWYCRVLPGLFRVPKPNTKLGIGIDRLSQSLQRSPVLTGQELAQLANFEEIPAVNAGEQARAMAFWYASCPGIPEAGNHLHHHAAKYLIKKEKMDWAWQVLLPFDHN